MNRAFWHYLVCGLTLVILTPFMRTDNADAQDAGNVSKLKIGETAPKIWGWDGALDFYSLNEWIDEMDKVVLLELWSLKDEDRDVADERIFKLSNDFAREKRFHTIRLCIEAAEWENFTNYDIAFRKKETEYFATQKQPKPYNVMLCISDPAVVDPPDDESKFLRKTYELEATPSYFLLGPKRKLLASKIDPQKLKSVIADHLKASSPSP